MRFALCVTVFFLVSLPARGLSAPEFSRFQRLDPQNHLYRDLTGSEACPDSVPTCGAGARCFGGTVWDSGQGRWEAGEGTWTFESGVGSFIIEEDPKSYPFVNPYKAIYLHGGMEGWIGVDNTYTENAYFRRMGGLDPRWVGAICVGSYAGLEGEYSFWAGVLPSRPGTFADDLCYAGRQGYGNKWSLCIEQTFAFDGNSPVIWRWDYVADTEQGYDYTHAIIDTLGSGEEVIVYSTTGSDQGTAEITLNHYDLPSTARDIVLKYCVVTDAAYSDEDGFYDTGCGALAIDVISVTGGGIAHTANFETGDDGWALSPFVPGAGGDWSNLAALADLPAPVAPCGCSMGDSVLVFDDLTVAGHGQFQDNLAVSPWIDLLQYNEVGTPGKFVAFDGYFDMPYLNYCFVQTAVQWYPRVCPSTGVILTSPFVSDGFFRYFGDEPHCTFDRRATVDFSGVIPPGAEEVRVGVGVINLSRFFATSTGISNSTPWFDNIQFGVYGNPALPLVTVRTIDVPQDATPEKGTFDIPGSGRFDSNVVKGDYSPELETCLGDTLVVQSTGDDIEMYVQFFVFPGPGVDLGALANLFAKLTPAGEYRGYPMYEARIDTAEINGVPFPGTWMTTFHESAPGFSGSDTDIDPIDIDPKGGQNRLANDVFPDDLFTPGSRVEMFYKARFVGSTSWSVYPDTSCGLIEYEVLPTSLRPDSTFNCILYVDHYDGWGGQPLIEEALGNLLGPRFGNFEETKWDRWDVRAPSSHQQSWGRTLWTENGFTVHQALGYDVILWDSGDLPSFNLVKEDADIYSPWLLLSDWATNNLYLSGDKIASSMTLEGASEPSAVVLLEELAGVLWTCSTFREAGCPPATVATIALCLNVDPKPGALVASVPRVTDHVATGFGCPLLYPFDVLEANPGLTAGTPIPDEEYFTPLKTADASIANDADFGPSGFKTVVDGVSVHHRRGPLCNSPQTIEDRLDEVLGWFGYLGGDLCINEVFMTGVEDDFRPAPGFRTELLQVTPNPILAGTPGRIRFTMEREGNAAVGIFDISGRLVRRVFHGPAREGMNEAFWDGTDLSGRAVANGVYFYRFQALQTEQSKKLVLIGSR